MMTLKSIGIAILLLGLAQDFLSVPVFVRGEDQTPDRTSRDRRTICHYLCSSKRNEPFRKVRFSIHHLDWKAIFGLLILLLRIVNHNYFTLKAILSASSMCLVESGMKLQLLVV